MPWWEPSDLFRQLYTTVLQQNQLLQQLNEKVDHLMTSVNATQADIDGLVASLNASENKIQAAVTALQAQISAGAVSGLDISGLKTAVAILAGDAEADTPAAPETPPVLTVPAAAAADPAPADPAPADPAPADAAPADPPVTP